MSSMRNLYFCLLASAFATTLVPFRRDSDGLVAYRKMGRASGSMSN